jgi:hypothetical protein
MRRAAVVFAMLVGCGDDGPATKVDAGAGDGPVGDGPDGGTSSGLVGMCSPDDWCWVDPVPQGNEIVAAWIEGGVGYAAGRRGTILRLDNGEWKFEETFPMRANSRVDDIWATGTTIYLTAMSELWRRQNGTWTRLNPSGGFDQAVSVWGSGASDVWVAMDDGEFAHYDGTTWSVSTVIDAVRIEGRASNDVWAVGHEHIAHWDGAAWTSTNVPAIQHPTSIYPAAANDVWVHLRDDGVLHYTGTTWDPVDIGADQNDDTFQVGGTAPNDIYVTGQDGDIYAWDGTAWTLTTGACPRRNMVAIAGTAGGELWVLGESGCMATRDRANDGWTTRWENKTLRTGQLHAFEDQVFIAETNGMFVRDGITFRGALTLKRLWSNATDLYGIGNGYVNRWNSATDEWTMLHPIGLYAPDLHGSGAYLVVADGNTIHEYDGSQWTMETLPSGFIQDVFAFSPTDVWAVGGNGIVMHKTASGWSTIDIGAGTALLANVWGVDQNRIYIASHDGQMIWRGPNFTLDTSFPMGTRPASFWSSSPTDVWAIGFDGLVLRDNGGGWVRHDAFATEGVSSITGFGGHHFIGSGGVLHHAP